MSTLRDHIIRLAYDRTELRPHLLPILKEAWAQTPQEQSIGEWVLKWDPKSYKTIYVDHPDWSDSAVLQGSNIVYDAPHRVPPDIQAAVRKMFQQVRRASEKVAARLEKYFEAKRGQKIWMIAEDVSRPTGIGPGPRRRYIFEVVDAEPTVLSVNVRSVDLVPSGYELNNTDARYGMQEVPYARTPDDTLIYAARQADPKWFRGRTRVTWK